MIAGAGPVHAGGGSSSLITVPLQPESTTVEYRQMLAELNSVVPPQQPWLAISMADYCEKLVNWNPVCTKNGALYYQFSTGSSQDSCFMLPDGCINLLVKCSETSPKAWISGIHESCTNLKLEPNTTYFGFKPYSTVGMKMKLFEISAAEIANNTTPLPERSELQPLWEKLYVADSLQERIKVFQNHAMSSIIDQDYTPSFVEYCAILICVSGGNISLEEIEKETGYSQRYCREKFRETYGISIKQYSRIVRIQSALTHIMMKRQTKLTEIAYDTGFFDQSHFINEFKRLVSLSPSKFRKTYLEMLKKYDISHHEITADACRHGTSIRRNIKLAT